MRQAMSHDQTLVRAFTEQADLYANNSVIRNTQRLQRLVEYLPLHLEPLVLDVATGPGFVATTFAPHCRAVIGIDLTDKPLRIAQARCSEEGIRNVSFCLSHVERMPFRSSTFTVAVSRFAFHHFVSPLQVVQEMTRVVQPRGWILIEDLIASEFPERAAFQNDVEGLRDPSHVNALSLSQILALLTQCRVEMLSVSTNAIVQVVEQWLHNARTPKEIGNQVVQRLATAEAEVDEPMQPFRSKAGELCIMQQTAIILGRKLS
jgi:ubiquinone/menaquinone biosynthesis C-methylase UbiE